jgi:acetyl esterase/lipase
MNLQKLPTWTSGCAIVLLLLFGCNAPADTPESVAATATPMPPPATQTVEPVRRKVMYSDIPYIQNGDRQQILSIYLPLDAPDQPQKTYPILFLAHAYTMGKDTEALWDVIKFVNSQDMAAVAIDYRDDLKTGGAWPAHNDTACALAWVYANAADFSLDADHMVAFGNSYGVNLLADVAMADDPGYFLSDCPNSLPDTRPFSGVVAFGAGTFGLSGPELTFATEAAADLFADVGLFDRSANEILATMQAISEVQPLEWAAYDGFGEQDTGMAQVLPVYWADPSDPPFLILTGEGDLDFWTLEDRLAFVDMLQGLGVEATHHLLPDTGHFTFGRDASAWQTPLGEFLNRVLENQ